MRLIDKGEHIGVVPTKEALEKAEERGLDLVEITQTDPPVCKILDYGKYLYEQKKKEQAGKAKSKAGEIKGIRLTFNISEHDLETRKRKTIEFLNKNYKVRVLLSLRGRENALKDHARKKINHFLEKVKKELPIKVERKIKKERGGLATIISKET